MKTAVWYMLIAWSATGIDAAKIKASIEKEIKDRISHNSHGKVSYETISMSDLQPQDIPFYCTPRGSRLADSIYEQSEIVHVSTFNTIVSLTGLKETAPNIHTDDSILKLRTAEREYRKALHRYYLNEAAAYAAKPDTEYHLEITFRLTGTNKDGSPMQLIDSFGYTINAKSLVYEKEEEFVRQEKFLGSGCDHNGWLMLKYPDEENWSSPPSPPPPFH